MEVYEKQEDAILVLGMARSGTSMASSLVQRWANYKGDPCKGKLVDPANPNGYFESDEVQLTLIDALNYLVQNKNISSWSPSFNDHLGSLVSGRKRFASALEKQFKSLRDVGVPWCAKVPLLSVTVALWEHFVRDPVLIITVRNPYDTAISLLKYEHKKESKKGIELYLLGWQHYLTRILKDTAKFERRFFINYEQVLENPESQLSNLDEFLGRQFPNRPKQENALKDMLEMVDMALHRNSSVMSFEQCSEATQTQKELYALLQKIAMDQKVPASIDYDKYQLTDQEIKRLEENDLYFIPDLDTWSIYKHLWNICKYMVGKLKVARR